MAITSVSKDGGYLVIVENGITKRRSIVYEDAVCSLPPDGYTEVGVIYVDEANNKLVIQYNGSTTEIELDATADLTGAEIVALLEALGSGSRLEVTYLDDGSTYIRFTVAERTKLGNIETGATADQTGAEIVALLEALTAGNRLSHTKLDDLTTGDPHTQYTKHSLATAVSDFLVASGAGVFIKKTLAEVKTILGLGTAAYTAATDYITHALATAANDFLVASGSGTYIKKTLAETLTILGKAAASGLASLNASSKVVQQPASITDHLDGSPVEDDATKAPTSEWAFDHKADTGAHHSRLHDHSLAADSDLLNPMAMYRVDNGCLRVLNPKGGAATWGSAQTGAIQIKLPTYSRDMLFITGDVYPYLEDKGFKFIAGGYAYSPGTWIKTFARIIGKDPHAIKVRFARNADSTEQYILLGETTTSWPGYTQVAITSVSVGYGQAIADYKEGWEISIVDDLTGYAIARTIDDATIAPEIDAKITTHETGGKHRWTADKLLKGAGAGADPTEIDVPSGVTIATGSYTGNDTQNRQITTGMKCSLVIVMGISQALAWFLIPATGCVAHGPTSHWDETHLALHATDGFVVDDRSSAAADTDSNSSPHTYNYWAISE